MKEELKMCEAKMCYSMKETLWASPMVEVVRKNDTIRICSGPKKEMRLYFNTSDRGINGLGCQVEDEGYVGRKVVRW